MNQFVLIAYLVFFLPLFSYGTQADVEIFDDLLKNKISECEGHYDIKPYLKLVLHPVLQKEAPSELISNLTFFSTTGSLPLSKDESSNPMSVKCAAFAEGFIMSKIISVWSYGE